MRCGLSSAIAPDVAKLTRLKRLEISGLPAVDDKLMSTVAALPNLQEFSISHAKVTDSGMADLSRSPNLSYVRVFGVAITDEGIESLVKLPKLLALNVYAEESDNVGGSSDLGKQTKVTDVGLEHIGRCHQLESLNIHGAKVSLAGLQKLFERCPELRHLALSRSAVDLGALEAASSLANLESIRITGTELSDQDASQLSRLKNLREIAGVLRVGNEGVEQLASLQHLESLQFSGDADDRCMAAVAKLRNLKQLSIQHTNITDDGLEMLKGLPRLEAVKLEDVTLNGRGFTSRCLHTVATWPKLDRLLLWNLAPRQDGKAEWSEISMLPATVRTLDILNCPEIGDEQLHIIGSHPNLESLSIQAQGMKAITDAGAGYLARAPKLKSLTIRPSWITNQGLMSLQSIESLESLDISCIATSVGLESLGQHKRLESLAIRSPNLSAADAEGFRSRHPHVRQFRFDEADFSHAQALGQQDSILRKGALKEREQLNALEGKFPPALHATAWTSTDGEVKLEQLRGHVLLIEFWGTWCDACLKDLPRIRELHAKYREKGLVVVTIHSTTEADTWRLISRRARFLGPMVAI